MSVYQPASWCNINTEAHLFTYQLLRYIYFHLSTHKCRLNCTVWRTVSNCWRRGFFSRIQTFTHEKEEEKVHVLLVRTWFAVWKETKNAECVCATSVRVVWTDEVVWGGGGEYKVTQSECWALIGPASGFPPHHWSEFHQHLYFCPNIKHIFCVFELKL